MTESPLQDIGILTVASEAMEGEMVCGMEVEIAWSSIGGGTSSNNAQSVESTDCLSLPSSNEDTLKQPRWNNKERRESTIPKLGYGGPFLPNSCEIDDVADGRCSPVYNLKRRISRSKQLMQQQLTNPTLSINSMTDGSDCPSCPSDEVSPTSYVQQVEESSDNTEAELAQPRTLGDIISSSTEETNSSDISSSASGSDATHESSLPGEVRAEETTAVRKIVYGPHAPPNHELTESVIDVIEPSPDRQFVDMIERSFWGLRYVTVNRSDLHAALFNTNIFPFVLIHQQPSAATLVAMRDCGSNGFILAPVQSAATLNPSPLTIHADNAGTLITIGDISDENACYSIFQSLQLVEEAARLKSHLNALKSGLLCCKSDVLEETRKIEPIQLKIPQEMKGDDEADHEDGASTILFEDEELRMLMAETKGGNDLTKLLSCLSDDTIGSMETDDGLRRELKALDTIESDLRKQLQDVDLLIKGVYVQDVKMKSESSDSLFERDISERRLPVTPKPSSSRKVHFSRKNKEYVFDGLSEEEEDDREEGLGEMILTTCEDLYFVLEEMSEEIGYACIKAFGSGKEKCETKPPPASKRPVRLSTIHYCA